MGGFGFVAMVGREMPSGFFVFVLENSVLTNSK